MCEIGSRASRRRVSVSTAAESAVYQSSGRLSVAGGARFQFADTDTGSGVTPRCVIVDTSGYPRVEARAC